MPELYDVAAIGNAIVDVIAPCTDDFLAREGLAKGSMMLIEEARGVELYGRMAAGLEASGGSAANTMAGVASLGGRAAYVGKVGEDGLGRVFAHDINAIGVSFETRPLPGGPATARSLINVTPDGQRTMSTYLGAASLLTPDDIDPAMIEGAKIVYLEGYLFDPSEARRAFAKAAGIARASGRKIALSLSDAFVVDRHRQALIGFIDSQVDILLGNEAELTSLFETSDFDAAVAALKGRVAIAAATRGAEGSLVIAGDQIHRIGAAPVQKVVDTTGAGDQYAAGFLFGLAQGRALDVCGRLGSLAAAEVIDHYGPRPQVPLKDLALKAGL